MTTITHALAPVVIARLFSGKSNKLNLSKRDYIWIAIAGGLADIINPHYYLKDRLTSWSHGVPFWVCFSVALTIFALCNRRRFPLKLAFISSAAYIFHLFIDAISGGINALYPLTDYFIMYAWIPFNYWIPVDVLNILLVYFLFRKRFYKSTSPTEAH